MDACWKASGCRAKPSGVIRMSFPVASVNVLLSRGSGCQPQADRVRRTYQCAGCIGASPDSESAEGIAEQSGIWLIYSLLIIFPWLNISRMKWPSCISEEL